MPLFGTIVDLDSAAKAAGTPLADVTNIAGAYKTYLTLAELNATASSAPDRFAVGQILYVSASNELYKVDSIDVDPITFSTIVVTSSFSWPGSGGGSVDTGSLLVTASATSNVITFTKGDASTFNVTVNTGSGGGGSVDTGSFFVSASTGNSATGTTVYTKGDGTTLTTSFGSSYQIVDGVPNVEVIAQPNTYFTYTGNPNLALTDHYYIENVPVSGQPNFTSIILRLVNSTSGWGSAYSGSVLRFKESGSNTNWSYYGIYEVNPIVGFSTNVYATVLPNSDRFGGNVTASINLFAQAPSIEYQSSSLGSSQYTLKYDSTSNSIGKYPSTFAAGVLAYATGSAATGTSPNKTYLYVSPTPDSGSSQMLQGGQYIGFSTDNLNWIYYVVLGETFTYGATSNTYVTIEPVDGIFYAVTGTTTYLGIFNEIPSQPYYRQLSHIEYPITPTSTTDATGSIGDVSYDNNNFYVKRSNGWGKAPLLDIGSGSLITTASVSDNTLTFTKNDGSTFDLTVNTGSGGGSVDTGSLLVTASAASNVITFTKGDASTFNVTVNSSSFSEDSQFAITSSYALTSSYLEGTAISASYALTASYALNGGGGSSTDTSSFFLSASSYGPSGSIIFTQGDGGTQTVTLGSSFVNATLPNSEIIVAPTESYKLVGTATNFPAFKSISPTPSNFSYTWTPTVQGATLMFRDDTNSEWGNVGSGDYIAFNAYGSSNLPEYYQVFSVTNDVTATYGVIKLVVLYTASVQTSFSGAATASFQGSVSVPNVALPQRISLGRYGNFTQANNLSTNYTNQTVLVSGSTPSGSWLYFGVYPDSGSAFSAQSGYYIGLGATTSSFTYYVVNGESYINASNDYFIGITPVAGEYQSAPLTDVYIESARWIPAQPYYNNLSHITYPITPTSTTDATGSIGDVSYDNNNFYVKRQVGWGKAPLLDIDSGSLLTTASVSDNTLTFTKNDGSTFDLTVNTGSGGGGSIDTGSFATTGSNTFTGNQTIEAITILTAVSESHNYVDDAAAFAGGIPIGGLYRNGNVIMIRLN